MDILHSGMSGIGEWAMRREFEINGCIEVPMELSEDEFWNKFIGFVEENNWYFGGGAREIIDGFYINEDGTKGEHCLDEDLRILVLRNQKHKAIELYMDLISNDLKEAEDYVDNISKNI